MLFGNRDEAIRLDQPAQRMLPSGQHFEADDFARGQIDLRLEVRHELAVLQAVAIALLDLAVNDPRAIALVFGPMGMSPLAVQAAAGVRGHLRPRGEKQPLLRFDLLPGSDHPSWSSFIFSIICCSRTRRAARCAARRARMSSNARRTPVKVSHAQTSQKMR
jgi:hypothetical protein